MIPVDLNFFGMPKHVPSSQHSDAKTMTVLQPQLHCFFLTWDHFLLVTVFVGDIFVDVLMHFYGFHEFLSLNLTVRMIF